MSASILQRVAGGDAGAVCECIDEYGALVWSLSRRFSRTPSDAEDATQEIFLQLWRQASRFDDSLGSEKRFIALIARRRLIDRLRKTAAVPPMDSSTEAFQSLTWSGPDNSAETSLEVEQAMLALAGLKPEYRRVLELGLLHGFTQSEIASRQGLPLGTVKSYMRRGLMRVRESMDIDVTPASPFKPHRSQPPRVDDGHPEPFSSVKTSG